MRDYAKIGPKAWQGETFKALRKRGQEALIVGLYLMTSPSSNMLGLFSQPVLYMAHETGLGEDGALKGLQGCIEVGFCSYDIESEVVWVHEMARYQIAEELKAADLRCKGIQKEYAALPKNPFLGPFFDRYAASYHLTARREYGDARQGSLIPPYQAPSKPRTGEGEGERTGIDAPPAATPAPPPAASIPAAETPVDPRGSRLQADWKLPADWAEWCEQNRPDLDPQTVAAGFRDFWVGKAGKDARKADWLATWRNWCRGQKPGSRQPGAKSGETFV